MYRLLTFFTCTSRLTTKLNPSPLIFDSPKVTFESHDLHFIVLLKVVNSDANYSVSADSLLYTKISIILYLISKTSNYYLKQTKKKKKIDVFKFLHCPDPLERSINIVLSILSSSSIVKNFPPLTLDDSAN